MSAARSRCCAGAPIVDRARTGARRAARRPVVDRGERGKDRADAIGDGERVLAVAAARSDQKPERHSPQRQTGRSADGDRARDERLVRHRRDDAKTKRAEGHIKPDQDDDYRGLGARAEPRVAQVRDEHGAAHPNAQRRVLPTMRTQKVGARVPAPAPCSNPLLSIVRVGLVCPVFDPPFGRGPILHFFEIAPGRAGAGAKRFFKAQKQDLPSCRDVAWIDGRAPPPIRQTATATGLFPAVWLAAPPVSIDPSNYAPGGS